MSDAALHPEGSKTVVLVGGGNIGSAVVPHLARNPAVGKLLIVDHDIVSAENITSQDFRSRDIGQYKAIALARRAREIRPRQPFRAGAIVARIEDVPWGTLLAADVLLGCVDSRLARSAINLISWRLGIAWIDAGINAEGALVRVETHIPGEGAPCIECNWGAKDRELLERAYSCDGRLKEPAPTGASSSLGALAASLLTLESQKLLNGSIEHSLQGKQLIVEANFHNQFLNSLRRNKACGFNHEIWSIQKAPASIRTVRDLIDHGRQLFGGELPEGISAERKLWVTRLACRDCRQQARAFRLQGRLGPKQRHCTQCGGEMRPVGFYLRSRIDVRGAADRLLDGPLRKLGLRSGDVLTLSGAHGDRHVEIAPAEESGGN